MADRVTRPPSSDEPSRTPRNRLAKARWRRTAGLYVMSDGGHVELAYVEPTVRLELGSRERLASEPDKNLWRVQKGGAEETPEYLTYSGIDPLGLVGDMHLTVVVRSTGVGKPSAQGPEGFMGSFPNRYAVSKDGSYCVIINNDGDATLDLHLWDAALGGWSPTVTDSVTVPGVNPFAADIAISVNGDVAVAGEPEPFVWAWPSSSAGFGTRYADPSPAPDESQEVFEGTAVEWHPSGEALLFGAEGGFGIVASAIVGWHFTTSVGFGSAYDAWDGTGFSDFLEAELIRFSPSGEHVASFSDERGYEPLFVGIWPFDLATGFGTRLTPPGSGEVTQTGSSREGYLAMSDTHLYTIIRKTGPSDSEAGLYAYPYGSGAINPGILQPDPPLQAFVFNDFPIALSRTGKFLAWFDDANNIINVYSVGSDGMLTLIGEVLTYFFTNTYALGWR